MIFKLLLIYVAAIPIMQTPNLLMLAQRIQFSDVVFLFLFALWMRLLIKEKRLPQNPGLDKPFLVFAFFCLLSFFNTNNLFISSIELLGLIYLHIMLILVTDIVDTRKKLDIIIKVWIATLAVIMALGFFGWCASVITGKTNIFCRWVYHGNFPYLKNITVFRPHSVFRHPIGLANYLLVSLGFVVSDLLLTQNKRYRIFLKIMLFFLSLTMLTILTREWF